MRAVLQKVLRASVTVDERVVGEISRGVCVLVGIQADDTLADLEYIAKKILTLRVFQQDPLDASSAHWKKSIVDLDLEVLCVSQFTLCAKTTKGAKPDFHQAMGSERSRDMFDRLVGRLGELHDPGRVRTGAFGEMMQVALVNDGPVTLTLDSRKFSYETQQQQPTGDAQKDRVAEKARAKDLRRQAFTSSSSGSSTPSSTTLNTKDS
ncbi:D-tyrosyl-tRNA(Tyr) deacylase [Coemansia interrupta]|uniref:D-aminoacyl-tRNA deacylase n=1 Tax=Coemansia interrupta TaxID=1126814 RepID=A0A9W8H9I8_9FUNG|nr:D-tyrosyl-tRNA(Tyr) deacylase [Coemansia interrupta]